VIKCIAGEITWKVASTVNRVEEKVSVTNVKSGNIFYADVIQLT
jgi:hypothetical protein